MRFGCFLRCLLGLLIISAGTSVAGDSGDSINSTINKIEKLNPESDAAKMIPLLQELWKPAESFVDNYDAFIAKGVMDSLEARTNKYRLRIIKVLDPLTEVKDKLVRSEVIAVLAYYNYPPAEQLLAYYPDGPQKAVFYAILGYDRSYRWALDRLDILARNEKAGQIAPLKDWMAYLNLLYYLAEPYSLPGLRRLIEDNKNPDIIARGKLVESRILKLHPEAR